VVREILSGLEDVHFAELTAFDVVRHRLVGQIVDAYGRWDVAQQRQQNRTARDGHEPRRPRTRRDEQDRPGS
jgi:phosphate starvation-inducible PhoH-like protein